MQIIQLFVQLCFSLSQQTAAAESSGVPVLPEETEVHFCMRMIEYMFINVVLWEKN
jgi:hypothetical protein